jgi:hypothetical protein
VKKRERGKKGRFRREVQWGRMEMKVRRQTRKAAKVWSAIGAGHRAIDVFGGRRGKQERSARNEIE